MQCTFPAAARLGWRGDLKNWRQRGFGIVEVMVGLVVGLVSMLVIMQVYSTFENQKRSTTTGSDAQSNGAIALYLLEREIRAGGNAINEGRPGSRPPVAGCKTWLTDSAGDYWVPNLGGSSKATAGTVSGVRFAPAIITDGGGGASDSLTVVYGTSAVTAPYEFQAPYAAGGATISLSSTSAINVGDMVVLVQENTAARGANYDDYRVPYDCAMLQVTALGPAAGQITVNTSSRYNKAGGFTSAGSGGTFSTESELFNVGQLNIATYHVDANLNLVADGTKFGVVPNGTVVPGAVSNSATPLPLASNIVNMQVQYGVDTGNTGVCSKPVLPGDADAVVDQWTDATGNWANNGTMTSPGLFDLRRIRAVRLGLVARSAVMEKGCDPSNAATWVTKNNEIVIHWDSDLAMNPDMKPDLSLSDANWACYRYKVFQVTVPLRNTIWSGTLNPAGPAVCR